MNDRSYSNAMKERHIETEKSFLDTFDESGNEFFKNLLDGSVDEIKDKLEVKPTIVVFNKECRQQRNVGFFSDESKGYEYSRKIMKSQEMTPSLKTLLDYINKRFDSNFNGILVNYYEDGSNTIGKHSDNEASLGKEGVVAISYGSPRKFRIRPKSGSSKTDIITKHLQILHMGGEFQKEFTHEIPKEAKIKKPRYSFTFRRHLK
jgi:alkylated DNA repair dioxygenase AlkB